jgi:hypothetical protein
MVSTGTGLDFLALLLIEDEDDRGDWVFEFSLNEPDESPLRIVGSGRCPESRRRD